MISSGIQEDLVYKRYLNYFIGISVPLAWKIPWTEEPGWLQSMGSLGLDTAERLHFHFHALEKEMATHSSILAWRIPGMGEPGGLPSVGSHRVRYDWSDLVVVVGNMRKSIFCWIYSWKYLLCEKNSLKWKRVFGTYDIKMSTIFTNVVFLKLSIFITSTHWILTWVSNCVRCFAGVSFCYSAVGTIVITML